MIPLIAPRPMGRPTIQISSNILLNTAQQPDTLELRDFPAWRNGGAGHTGQVGVTSDVVENFGQRRHVE